MSCSVFRVHPECIIIFLENFIQNERMFLRIGNSPGLHAILGDRKCSLLYSPLLVPSFETERELSKNTDIIYGSQLHTAPFIDSCTGLGLEIKKSTLSMFRGRTTIYLCGHEVTFYPEGNITISDHEKNLFDLQKTLRESITAASDRKIIRTFHGMTYGVFFKETGLMGVNDSLFFFSEGSTGCITFSSHYINDAVLGGFDPEALDFIYIVPGYDRGVWDSYYKNSVNTPPNSHRLLCPEAPPVSPLLTANAIEHSATRENTVEIRMGDFIFIFQNNRLTLFYKDVKIKCLLSKPPLQGIDFSGEYKGKSKRNDFSFSYGAAKKKSSAGLTSCTPLLFTYSGQIPDDQDSNADNTSCFKLLLTDDKKKSRTDSCYFQPHRLKSSAAPFSLFIALTSAEEVQKQAGIFEEFCSKKESSADDEDNQLFQLYSQRFSTLLESMEFYGDEVKKLNRTLMYSRSIPIEGFPPIESCETGEYKPPLNQIAVQPRPKKPVEPVNNKKEPFSPAHETRKKERKKKKKPEKKKKKEAKTKTRASKPLFRALLITSALVIVLFSSFFIGLRFILPKITGNKNRTVSYFLHKSAASGKPLIPEHIKTERYGFFMTLKDFRRIAGDICKKNNFKELHVKKSKIEIIPWWFYPGNVIIMPDNNRRVIKRNESLYKLCELFFISRTNYEESLAFSILTEVEKGTINAENARKNLEEIKKDSYSQLMKKFISGLLTVKDISSLE